MGLSIRSESHSHLISPQKLWKIGLQIFLDPFLTFQLMRLVQRWSVSAFLTMAMSLTTDLVLLDPPGRLQLWKMAALEDNGFLVASRLILLKCLVVICVFSSWHVCCNPVYYLQRNVWSFRDHAPISLIFQECCIPLKDFLQFLLFQHQLNLFFDPFLLRRRICPMMMHTLI